MNDVQWFVKPFDYFTKKSIAEWLASRGEISGSERVSVKDTKGKSHDVFRISSDQVSKLKRLKQSNPLFKFQFWKQNGSDGLLTPADFLEKKKPVKKMKEAMRQLAAIAANRVKK